VSRAPRVSVIVNCYNGERYLREALDSVLAQTHADWELILWDDQSTDASAAIFAGYTDPRFRYFRAARHTPLGEARALAIREARGEWLAFLDQDDLWLPDKLALQLALVAAEPGAEPGLVYGRAIRFDASGAERDYDQLHEHGPLPEGDIFPELMRHANFIAVSSAMLLRRAYEETGGIPPEYHVAAEYYLFSAICRGRRARALQNVCCRYRVHDSNLSWSSARRAHEEALRVVESWSEAIAPALLRRRRRIYQTLIGWEELRAGHPLKGALRVVRRGAPGYLLSRPFARAWRAARRRRGPTATPAIGWRETRVRLAQDELRLRAALASGQAPPAIWLRLHPSFLCVWLYRLSHYLLGHGRGLASRLLWQLNLFLTGADIHPRCDLGGGLLILHPVAASLSGHAGRNLTVMARAGIGGELARLDDVGAGPGLASLGDDVVLGSHAGVLGPVRVGRGVSIAAGCIVTKDVPPGSRVLPIDTAGASSPSAAATAPALPAEADPIAWSETRRRLASDRQRLGGRVSLGYICVWLHRVSHFLHRRKRTRLASICWQLNQALTGADIHPRSELGGGLLIPHPAGVTLDGRAGRNLVVLALSGIEPAPPGAGVAVRLPELGDDVELGPQAVVVGGVRVGSGARLGAGSVVREDVPPGATLRSGPVRLQGKSEASASSTPRAVACSGLGHGRLSSLRREVAEDVSRFLRQSDGGRHPAGRARQLSVLLMPGVLSLLVYRCSHALHARGFGRAAAGLGTLNRLAFKLSASPAACIAGGCFLPHPAGIVLDCSAGRELALYSHALCLRLRPPRAGSELEGPRLGDRVRLGVHSAIVGPASAGDDVRVAFRAVLERDAPSGCLVSSRAMRCRVESPAQPSRDSTES